MDGKVPQIDLNEVRLFAGRSNPELAAAIAKQLNIPLEETHVSRFSNDNLFVQLGASVRGRVVYILQSFSPPVDEHLMELLMMIDIAKSAAAREIHAIVPYFSYARSDKKDAPRISITAKLVADLLVTAGATHFMTMRLHSPQVHGFFNIPADPLTSRWLLADYFRQKRFDPDDTVVIAPDGGSSKSAVRFGEMLDIPVAVAHKARVSDSKVEISGLVGRQVRGFRTAIIHDDEIATGGTMAELCKQLVGYGVESIYLAVTHGLFLGKAVPRLAEVSEIKEVVVTDTVMRPPERRPANLTVLSTATVFSGAIQQNYFRQSIGELFAYGTK